MSKDRFTCRVRYVLFKRKTCFPILHDHVLTTLTDAGGPAKATYYSSSMAVLRQTSKRRVSNTFTSTFNVFHKPHLGFQDEDHVD